MCFGENVALEMTACRAIVWYFPHRITSTTHSLAHTPNKFKWRPTLKLENDWIFFFWSFFHAKHSAYSLNANISFWPWPSKWPVAALALMDVFLCISFHFNSIASSTRFERKSESMHSRRIYSSARWLVLVKRAILPFAIEFISHSFSCQQAKGREKKRFNRILVYLLLEKHW